MRFLLFITILYNAHCCLASTPVLPSIDSSGRGETKSSSSSDPYDIEWPSDFQLKEPIAQGGFGDIWRATYFGAEVVAKMALLEKRSSKADFLLDEEVEILKQLHHPNVIRLIGYCASQKMIVIENVNDLSSESKHGATLLNWCRVMKNEDRHKSDPSGFGKSAIDLLVHIAHGMRYIHHKGYVHFDLKLDNILVMEKSGSLHPIIADFGLSKKITSGSVPAGRRGTILYLPSELLELEEQQKIDATPVVDIWAFGIMIYEVLTLESRNFWKIEKPTLAISNKAEKKKQKMKLVMNSIRTKSRSREYSKVTVDMSAEIRSVFNGDGLAAIDELIARCLSRTPSDRPNWDEIINVLLRSLPSNETLMLPPTTVGGREMLPSSGGSGESKCCADDSTVSTLGVAASKAPPLSGDS